MKGVVKGSYPFSVNTVANWLSKKFWKSVAPAETAVVVFTNDTSVILTFLKDETRNKIHKN